MNRRYLLFTLAGAFTCLLQVRAEHIDGPTNDTIKTYNLGEVIITSSTKETNVQPRRGHHHFVDERDQRPASPSRCHLHPLAAGHRRPAS